ncbi:hypothetical protein GLX30_30385 [Streptomyces sp. Tu 2975]|uniref:hypothetical protein n=1 Tax=Streptomyces sp. Tu 2975 TaxID=2676871 RepID=UPI00135C4438|nr:hypothetical protein [Streptomyces sp. Tu 2975]QIP87623.1 hypothetical protein GLX30_30385 [Streptomyces sp. Tu 2975]
MNRRHRTARQAITAALHTSRHLAYRTLSGIVAVHVDQGRLIRTGDLLDRLGADLPDGQCSWYGRHVAKAYRAANDGAAAIKVWAQHRTTGRWIHVHVYSPVEPALYTALHTYKATRPLAAQAAYTEAA